MRRLFGSANKKPAAPQPTLGEVSKNLEARGDALQNKCRSIDTQLNQLKETMKKQKPNTPAYNATKQRALRLLKQRKVYERQSESVYNQQFNVDQAAFTHETLKDSMETVNAMKSAAKEIKGAYKAFNISELEDLHDDMSDLMEDANEIQDVLGRSYDVNDDLVDEDELDAELAALEDDMGAGELETGSSETPSYLANLPNTQALSAPSVPSHSLREREAMAAGNVDEFGLPSASRAAN